MLLVFCPLLLISIIFLSFNPDGLQPVPAGIVIESEAFSREFLEAPHLSFLRFSEYRHEDACIESIQRQHEYVCVVVRGTDALEFALYFDNTREPVIWEVLERIQQSLSLLEEEYSVALAQEMIQGVADRESDVQNATSLLAQTRRELAIYETRLREIRQDLLHEQQEILYMLFLLDEDIATSQQDVRETRSELNLYAMRSREALESLESHVASAQEAVPAASEQLQHVRRQIVEIHEEIYHFQRRYVEILDRTENQLTSSAQASRDARERTNRLDHTEREIDQAIELISVQQETLNEHLASLAEIHDDIVRFGSVDARFLISPFSLQASPTYIPSASEQFIEQAQALSEEEQAQALAQGINLMSLQTLFPVILLLLILFLSLLISSFSTLTHINSHAYQRLRTIPGLFLVEILALAVSSMVLLLLPITILVLIGEVLFLIPFSLHILPTLLTISLLAAIFVFLGMIFSFVIRKESITLVVVAFFFVFLTFFSGFLLPIERMSELAAYFSLVFPPAVSLQAISKTSFYGLPIQYIAPELFILASWSAVTLGVLLVIEAIRRSIKTT